MVAKEKAANATFLKMQKLLVADSYLRE